MHQKAADQALGEIGGQEQQPPACSPDGLGQRQRDGGDPEGLSWRRSSGHHSGRRAPDAWASALRSSRAKSSDVPTDQRGAVPSATLDLPAAVMQSHKPPMNRPSQGRVLVQAGEHQVPQGCPAADTFDRSPEDRPGGEAGRCLQPIDAEAAKAYATPCHGHDGEQSSRSIHRRAVGDVGCACQVILDSDTRSSSHQEIGTNGRQRIG